MCTVYVSRIITEGGGWIPKVNPELFQYECEKVHNELPYIRTSDFVRFMRSQPDVEVSYRYTMEEFSPDLLKSGDIVVLSQENQGLYNHLVFVEAVYVDRVEILELSGSASPPSYCREFTDVKTPINFFIIIRIQECYR